MLGWNPGICPPSPRLAHWIRASALARLAVPDPQVQGLLEGGQGGITVMGVGARNRHHEQALVPRRRHGQESARLHPIGGAGERLDAQGHQIGVEGFAGVADPCPRLAQ